MFIKKASEQDFFAELEKNLTRQDNAQLGQKIARNQAAIGLLVRAAELLEQSGLDSQADSVTDVADKLSLDKTAWEVPQADSASSGLTPEKMETNLKEKGWVFNADDGEILDVAVVESGETPALEPTGEITVEEEPEQSEELVVTL